MKIEKFFFEPHGDYRGQLVAIENEKSIPFDIKRVYYMYDTKGGISRGHHAHRNLKQVLVCVAGSCRLLLDDGKEREDIVLNRPFEGVYVDNCMWRIMYDFTPGTVLLVLASELYEPEDYIYDYAEFLKYVGAEPHPEAEV